MPSWRPSPDPSQPSSPASRQVFFRVTVVREFRKDSFPTSAVYGPAADPEVRLITCGGTFDPRLGSYLSNAVVYAVETS
jgi:hypothetical protein